ncbi:MAG: hypothetical protein GKR89_21230 [Candidatus Latescibacteria bacterium]|nr:hypothetical protein [Candidatus Latescibacterota bacterium]
MGLAIRARLQNCFMAQGGLARRQDTLAAALEPCAGNAAIPAVQWSGHVRLALWLIGVLVLAGVHSAAPQNVRTFRLGGTAATWQEGGRGIEPIVVGGTLFSPQLDTTNTPGGAIDFVSRSGWISPLLFNPEENIASRLLEEGASIKAPNAVEEKKVVRAQLAGTVNGDHRIAFERKPTRILPLNPFGIWVILDFLNPVGVERIRFYPRNTIEAIPGATFHNDFMRAFEVWVNDSQTSRQRSPDVLVVREATNEEPVVEIDIDPRYARLIKLKSLTEIPWEIDEIEVYATGYLQRATYLSDLIDLGDRATLGQFRWRENTVGREIRSELALKVRTGNDDSPLEYNKRVLDTLGVFHGETEVVSGPEYAQLGRRERDKVLDDTENWSPWKALENGALITAPGQRQYIQFQIDFTGELFDTRQLNWLSFDYLQPPLADTLKAEVFPRLVRAEERATFRYAVLLRRAGPARGYDRLEIDANAQVENIRAFTVNGAEAEFAIDFIGGAGFGLSFDRVEDDSTLVEFIFDVPIFRFGTTFSGRAYNSQVGSVPQRLDPGQALDFGQGDFDELSDLSVAIPRSQVGKLIGEIVLDNRVFTPNGDGVNDEFEIFYNLLQLTRPTPVVMDIYDLAGRWVHQVFNEERVIGPALKHWDGRSANGRLVPQGHYIWVLRVEADAFEERHSGLTAVVY